MSAKLKSLIAQGTTLTATIALAVGLSGCAADKSGVTQNEVKAPAPVTVAAAPPPKSGDPMAADPLFAAPPPTAATSGGSASGNASADASQRVPLGQLSGPNGPASQRVPLGALSKPQTETKPAQPAKATNAPLLIAPKPGENEVAAAMNAPPPPSVAPAQAAAQPAAKPSPAKAEAATPASKPNYSAPQPESVKPAAKPEPAAPVVASAAEAKPTPPKKKGLLDLLKGTHKGTEKDSGPGFMVPKTENADAEKPKLNVAPRKGAGSPTTPQDEDTVVISSNTSPPPHEMAQEFVPASLADVPQTDASGNSILDRPMTAAEKNVAQRFEALKTLLDEGLITPEEYSRHRSANIGALLPFTHDPGSAGLERPSAGAEAIVARLQALRRALEMHAISTQQHASERSMILAALLPAHPDEIAPPVSPPADVIQGAAITSRLQTLKTRGLISSDEYETERKAIDQYLRTGSFKTPAAVADKDSGGKGSSSPAAGPAKETKAKKEATPAVAAPAAAAGSETSEPAEVTGPVLHLASFRTREAAEKAWQEALAQNKSILANYREVIRKVDLGQGKGVFFRLMVGGFNNLADAENICIRLKANNQFCRASTSANGT